MIYFLDIFGTLVFAVSGALRATKHRLDILGLLVLSIATGVSGGIIRDLIIGENPPAAFRNELYLLTCLAGGIIVFLAAPKIARRLNVVMYADAIGLGVFAAIGAAKGASAGFGPVGVIMMGALTATGGGIVRDVLVREIPAVLRRDFYATAAMAGSAGLLIVRSVEGTEVVQLITAIAITTSLRLIAIFLKLQLPKAQRLTKEEEEVC